jgi:hypothetical protein
MTQKNEERLKEYYQILDLTETASPGEIDRQYERLVRLFQPKRMENAEDRAYAEAKLAEIERAYAVLSNPVKRSIYDGGDSTAGNGTPEETVYYCANHPDVETLLRCNRCSKPICMRCAVRTPVGYRCKECVGEQQKVYFNAVGGDNFVAFGVGFIVSAIAAPIVGLLIALVLGRILFLGLIIAFIAGSGAGSALAQIIRRAVGRRRGPYLPLFALVGIILGVLIGNFIFLIFTGTLPLFSLPMLLFTGLAIASAYPQLR